MTKFPVIKPISLVLPELSVDLFRSGRRSEVISPKFSNCQLHDAIVRYRKFLVLKSASSRR